MCIQTGTKLAGESWQALYEEAKQAGLKGPALADLLRSFGLHSLVAEYRVMADGLYPQTILARDFSAPVEDFPEYKRLFSAVVESMLRIVEFRIGKRRPRENVYYLLGGALRTEKPEVICDILYLGDDKYYTDIFIDLDLCHKEENIFHIVPAAGFVSSLAATHNIPLHTGPFIMARIEIVDSILQETLQEYGII